MKNLSEIDFKYRYSTGGKNDPVVFFTDALSNSVRFDLGLGFFSSASINVLALGFAHFIANGGTMRLYVNQFLSEEDYEAFTKTDWETLPEKMVSNFQEMCKIFSRRDRHFFNCLSFLIANNRISIRVVVPQGGGIAHQKFGIFTDAEANKISFTGSLNFTANALLKNIETIECDYSWKSEVSRHRIEETEEDFESIFTGQRDKIAVYEVRELERAIIKQFPNAETEQLLKEEKELVEEYAKEQSLAIIDEPKGDEPRFPFPKGPTPYQQEAYKAWVDKGYCGIFAMATGSGKTATSLNCVLEEYKKNGGKYKLLILVPTLDLVKQWVDEVDKFNFTNIFTVSGASNWREQLAKLKNDEMWGLESNYVIISTYDSFTNPVFQKIIEGSSSDMVLIADEAHNVGSASVRAAFEHLKISKRIALSATPKRNYDKEGTTAIETYFNDNPPYCYSFSMKQAIDEGFLMEYRYYPRLVYLDLEEMERYVSLTKRLLRHFDAKTGQFAKNPEVEKLLMQRKRIIHKAKDKYRVYENILDELNELGKTQYCFVYVPEGYSESGEDDSRIIDIMNGITHNKYPNISTNTYLGGEKGKKEKLRGFAEGRIDMLFAMKCLDEGVDVKRAEIGIFASSTGNPRQFIQRRGRLLRTHDDKHFARIYDMIVVPDFRSGGYSSEYFEMEKSQVRAELMRVSYFASLASNYNEAREQLMEVLDFYGFEIGTLIKELDEQ